MRIIREKVRPRLLIRLAMVVVFLAGLLWFALPPSEPKYEGVSLSTWLDRYARNFDSEPQLNEAADAVHHIGSNAAPCLVRWLTASDSGLKKRIKLWIDQHTHTPTKFGFNTFGYHDLSYRDRALLGFQILGPQAKSAIPSLERLLGRTNTVRDAATILCELGPEATPALLNGLKNVNPDIRQTIAYAIWVRENDINVASTKPGDHPARIPVALLVAMVRDPYVVVSTIGMNCLREAVSWKMVDASVAVPPLIEELKGSNLACESQAASTLASFGPAASNAVPVLVERLKDSDLVVRIAATNALKKIDPEAARRAGVK